MDCPKRLQPLALVPMVLLGACASSNPAPDSAARPSSARKTSMSPLGNVSTERSAAIAASTGEPAVSSRTSRFTNTRRQTPPASSSAAAPWRPA